MVVNCRRQMLKNVYNIYGSLQLSGNKMYGTFINSLFTVRTGPNS